MTTLAKFYKDLRKEASNYSKTHKKTPVEVSLSLLKQEIWIKMKLPTSIQEKVYVDADTRSQRTGRTTTHVHARVKFSRPLHFPYRMEMRGQISFPLDIETYYIHYDPAVNEFREYRATYGAYSPGEVLVQALRAVVNTMNNKALRSKRLRWLGSKKFINLKVSAYGDGFCVEFPRIRAEVGDPLQMDKIHRLEDLFEMIRGEKF